MKIPLVILIGIYALLLLHPSFGQALNESGGTETQLTVPETDALPLKDNEQAEDALSDVEDGYSVFRRETDQKWTGFQFANPGGNKILSLRDEGIGAGPERTWSFVFPDRARQGIQLSIEDIYNGTTSEFMSSAMLLFPRKQLPSIRTTHDTPSGEYAVTLTTGEEVRFDAKTREILSGALKETGPMDVTLTKLTRKFALVEYTGAGISVRVDRRGADPRDHSTAVIQQGKSICKLPSPKLFEQGGSSDMRFLFATDSPFIDFLNKNCKAKFKLPAL